LVKTPITAYSPPQNPFLAYMYINNVVETDYSAVRMVWHNQWNISREPVNYTRYVNGFPLTGSIVGADFQGGNAWINRHGPIPYTDDGLIYSGGDYLPLPFHSSGHSATQLRELIPAHGTVGSVRVDDALLHSRSASILVDAPTGSAASRALPTRSL
jgi:hypothetical protein